MFFFLVGICNESFSSFKYVLRYFSYINRKNKNMSLFFRKKRIDFDLFHLILMPHTLNISSQAYKLDEEQFKKKEVNYSDVLLYLLS